MNSPLTRHPALNAMIHAALEAADPAEAVRRHVQRTGESLRVGDRAYDLRRFDEVVLIAAGKAAVPMAEAAADLLADRLTRGVVVTKYGHVEDRRQTTDGGRLKSSLRPTPGDSRLTVIESGHPVPDQNSLRAGELVCETLSRCTERTLVVACISGGASALLIAPQPGISLAALRAINDALLRSGADIREMNAVRSRLDRLKGGGLARLAAPGQIAGLILSDVVGDPLDVIASGLTNDPCSHNVLVANNAQACEAAADAARGAGYETTIVTTTFSGEARERGREIALSVSASPQPQPHPRPLPSFGYAQDEFSPGERGVCLIYGGETTVTVRGSGKGGRNQELALAAAIELGRGGPCGRPSADHEAGGRKGRPYAVIAAVGTDGTDGPTDAAGAVAYPDTLDRSRRLGLDAEDHLRRNDSYAFFAALGDLVMTGPTGTNVADIVIALQN